MSRWGQKKKKFSRSAPVGKDWKRYSGNLDSERGGGKRITGKGVAGRSRLIHGEATRKELVGGSIRRNKLVGSRYGECVTGIYDRPQDRGPGVHFLEKKEEKGEKNLVLELRGVQKSRTRAAKLNLGGINNL